jgi:type IV secretion system protein VirD4
MRKLFLNLIVILSGILVIYILTTLLVCFITNINSAITFKLFISNLTNELSVLLTFSFSAFYTGFVLYTAWKAKIAKNVEKIRRSKSDQFGKSKFMSEKEKFKYFGNGDHPYSFKNLASMDFSGFMIESWLENEDIKFLSVADKHSLIIGGTGSGKTSRFLAPTIQANAKSKIKASMLFSDLKGELFTNHSKKLEEEGYTCIIINLRDPHKSMKYNPLDLIWTLFHRYQEDKSKNSNMLDKVASLINEFATTICPRQNSGDNTWADGAQGILAGMLWAMLEDSINPNLENYMTKDKFTIQQLSNLISKQSNFIVNHLFKDRDGRISRAIENAAMIINNESEKTVASYISSCQTYLRPYLDSGVQYITSATDFSLLDLITKPTAIFLVIPDEDQSRYVLATLMIAQIYNFLTFASSNFKNIKLPRPFYFMLDEFGNCPKISNFPIWISVARSKNIFFMLILQAYSQLKKVYGDNEAIIIMNNCTFNMFLGSSETSTLKQFQERLGTYTIVTTSIGINEKNTNSANLGSASKHLVNLDELTSLKLGESYYTADGGKVAKGKLVAYYEPEIKKLDLFHMGQANFSSKYVVLDELNLYYDLEIRIKLNSKINVKESNDLLSKNMTNNNLNTLNNQEQTNKSDLGSLNNEDIPADPYEKNSSILKNQESGNDGNFNNYSEKYQEQINEDEIKRQLEEEKARFAKLRKK